MAVVAYIGVGGVVGVGLVGLVGLALDGSVRRGGTAGALVLVAEDGRGPVPVDETVGGRRWPEGDHADDAVGADG
ncbi:hypothetical protein ACFZCL_05190 [Streptomyces sp. NPDC008159]|uniref:hypothetical protein n=1 Tax=Streptomyces sp. NPDC008159 TaxID=3364817 RepID=UPI0036F17982